MKEYFCPPDYNSGFCDEPTEKMCKNCWEGWYEELKINTYSLNNKDECIEYLLDIIKDFMPVFM